MNNAKFNYFASAVYFCNNLVTVTVFFVDGFFPVLIKSFFIFQNTNTLLPSSYYESFVPEAHGCSELQKRCLLQKLYLVLKMDSFSDVHPL